MEFSIPYANPNANFLTQTNSSALQSRKSVPVSHLPKLKNNDESKNVLGLLEESRKLELIHRSLVEKNKLTNKQIHYLRLPTIPREESAELEKSSVSDSAYIKPEVPIHTVNLEISKEISLPNNSTYIKSKKKVPVPEIVSDETSRILENQWDGSSIVDSNMKDFIFRPNKQQRTTIYHVEDIFSAERKSSIRPITSERKQISVRFAHKSLIGDGARAYEVCLNKLHKNNISKKLKPKRYPFDSFGVQLERNLPRKLRSNKELEAWTYFAYGNEAKSVFDLSDIAEKAYLV
ncbi:unnamed protein product [Blepharisma stoltei]|uniref:Uncharacterized protein n=1 Tax=Blepharisma stoltei TaxID=1481888 RepID=A0AAU9IST8_9CILI|nr:unnamed protein product [Blepharisma stoltei]